MVHHGKKRIVLHDDVIRHIALELQQVMTTTVMMQFGKVANDTWLNIFPPSRRPSYLSNILAYLCLRRRSQKAEHFVAAKKHSGNYLQTLPKSDQDEFERYMKEDLGLHFSIDEHDLERIIDRTFSLGSAFNFWKLKNHDNQVELHFLNNLLNLGVKSTLAPSAGHNRYKGSRQA